MLYLLIAAAVCALDQAFKYWVVQHIALNGRFPLIDGVIHLTYVRNTGAAFSMLSDKTWLLAAVSCVCIAALAVAVLRKRTPKVEKWLLAMIMGGALGNAIDRIRLGYVVDMFEVEFTDFLFLNAVFNVADAFITCAGIVFCIVYIAAIFREEKQRKDELKRGMPELERLRRGWETAAQPAAEAVPAEEAAEESAEEPAGDEHDDKDRNC